MFPELLELDLRGEAVDCTRCAMSAEHSDKHADDAWTFLADVKCCTFYPELANFLVGSALERGGVSEALMRRQIASGVGRTPHGIEPDPEFQKAYFENTGEVFGRSRDLACPYWVGGELSCGIWHDRNHVCRTWFCRNEAGGPGRRKWGGVQQLLSLAERLLAAWCVRDGVPPPDSAPPAAWEAWYRWCARRVAQAPEPILRMLREQEGVEPRVAKLKRWGSPARGPLTDVVIPSLSSATASHGQFWVAGYSGYDGVYAPDSLYQFLSRLDGATTWQDANAALATEGHQVLPRAVIEEMFRIGALKHPQPGDVRGTEAGFEQVEGGMFLRFVEAE